MSLHLCWLDWLLVYMFPLSLWGNRCWFCASSAVTFNNSALGGLAFLPNMSRERLTDMAIITVHWAGHSKWLVSYEKMKWVNLGSVFIFDTHLLMYNHSTVPLNIPQDVLEKLFLHLSEFLHFLLFCLFLRSLLVTLGTISNKRSSLCGILISETF